MNAPVTIANTPRIATYNPVASAGPFVVPFPLFDSTGADLSVTLNGVALTGWTLTSDTSPGFYGAPNTFINGSVALATPVTGTLVVAGRRAPRRTEQFQEGVGVPARDLNTAFNVLTAVERELFDAMAVEAAARFAADTIETAARKAADAAEVTARNAAIQAAIAYVVATPPFSNSILDVPVTVSGLTESIRDHLLHRPTYLKGKFGDKSVVTPAAVYTAAGAEPGFQIYEGVDFNDLGVQGMLYIPAGAPMGNNVTAVAGYFWNSGGGFGSVTNALNAVSLFGAGVVAADNTAGWGVNTLLTDWYTRAVGTGVNRILIGGEFDFNVMCTGTQLIGLSVGGNGLAQPGNANAFLVNSLGHIAGNEIRWGTGFWSLPGAATVGLAIGQYYDTPHVASASRSQELWFSSYNADGTTLVTSMHTESGFFIMQGAPGGYKLIGGPLLLDAGVQVGGNQVLGGRAVGWGLPTGALSRAAFQADYTQVIGGVYDQAQVQALQTQVTNLSKTVGALIRDFYAGVGHGALGA